MDEHGVMHFSFRELQEHLELVKSDLAAAEAYAKNKKYEYVNRVWDRTIFLCHSHTDKVFVRQLAKDLEFLDVAVWFDEWELSVGDSLHGCIGAALNCAAFIGVVLSPDSIMSKWCRDELEQALSREKRTGAKI